MTLTLDLAPAILARAEARAAREGITLTQLVEQLVREELDRRENHATGGATTSAQVGAPSSSAGPAQRAFPPLPVFDGGGFPPGVDPRSNASLSAAADAEEDEKYLRIARGELP